MYAWQNYFETNSATWDQRKLSRVLTMKAQSQSIASSVFIESTLVCVILIIVPSIDFKAEYGVVIILFKRPIDSISDRRRRI
jgi:hypothetical protein